MSGFNPDIHIPGVWRCAKCGFRRHHVILGPNGSVGAQDDPGERCPNDGSPLWRVTWKQDLVELERNSEPLFERDRIVAAILAEEGATVTFAGDNPDFNGLPNSWVGVSACFTGWEEQDFRADSVIEALRLAWTAKQEFEAKR